MTSPPKVAEEQNVRVDLGSRSYDILIGPGALLQLGQRLDAIAEGARCVVVADANVRRHHGKALESALDGRAAHWIEVDPGEKSKSWPVLQKVCEQILDAGLERRDVLIAFGGGVVGDLAGFAAGIARRGMPFIQVPTSLLAQVDSSVGGKTGINSAKGKNLIGLFNQPQLVIADTGLLDTLPERELRAGYAEIVKYGLLGDAGFFDWLEMHHQGVLKGSADRVEAVATSCRAKAVVVKADELEGGQRALLNLGHTFGHALEAAVGYDGSRLVHGEGVAIGMMLAHEFSNRLGLCAGQDVERVRAHLRSVGLPTTMGDISGPGLSVEGLMASIAQDKKVERGALTFILTRGIGKAFVERNVDPAAVAAFLHDRLSDDSR